MFILVKLLNGFSRPLWYKVPQEWCHEKLVGSLVNVPLRAKHFSALVLETRHELEFNASFKIKEALHIEPIPPDPHYWYFLSKLSTYYQIDQVNFVRRMRHFLGAKSGQNSPDQSDNRYLI